MCHNCRRDTHQTLVETLRDAETIVDLDASNTEEEPEDDDDRLPV